MWGEIKKKNEYLIDVVTKAGLTVQYNTNLLFNCQSWRPIYWAEQLSELHTFDFILIGLIGFTTKKEGQHNKWINPIIKSDPAWWSYIISRYLLALPHHV
jgi:hypothetical protein